MHTSTDFFDELETLAWPVAFDELLSSVAVLVILVSDSSCSIMGISNGAAVLWVLGDRLCSPGVVCIVNALPASDDAAVALARR